jgi:hypothetical protein
MGAAKLLKFDPGIQKGRRYLGEDYLRALIEA